MRDALAAFDVINNMNRAFYKAESAADIVWGVFGGILTVCALSMFVLACAAAVVVNNIDGTRWVVPYGLASFGVSMIASFMVILGNGATMLVQLANIKEYEIRSMRFEMAHDTEYARELAKFDSGTLDEIDEWLSIRIDRLKGQISSVFGGHDRIPIIVIFLGGYAVTKDIFERGVINNNFIIGVYALLIGLWLGATINMRHVKKYEYRRQLLKVAKIYNINEPTQ